MDFHVNGYEKINTFDQDTFQDAQSRDNIAMLQSVLHSSKGLNIWFRHILYHYHDEQVDNERVAVYDHTVMIEK
jgi:hypothetical protein